VQGLQIVSCSRVSLKDSTKPKHILETWIQIPTFPCLRVHHDYVYKPDNLTLLTNCGHFCEGKTVSFLFSIYLSVSFPSFSYLRFSLPQWMTQFLKYARRNLAFYPLQTQSVHTNTGLKDGARRLVEVGGE